MAESGKDRARNAALERLVKCKLSLFESEDDIRLTKLKAGWEGRPRRIRLKE